MCAKDIPKQQILYGEVDSIEEDGSVTCYIEIMGFMIKTAFPRIRFGDLEPKVGMEIAWNCDAKTIVKRTWDNTEVMQEFKELKEKRNGKLS